MPLTWAGLDQVHGAAVVHLAHPPDGAPPGVAVAPGVTVAPGIGVDQGGEGPPTADAAVTGDSGLALAVLTADCAPVALASPEGVIGIVHAGWRGLLAGVVGAAVDAMRTLGATELHALIGPCIHPGCYPFSADDLDYVVRRGGEALRGRDRCGRPALDLPAGVRAALARAGAVLDEDADTCTACSPAHWSWRARGDRCRQATVVWRT